MDAQPLVVLEAQEHLLAHGAGLEHPEAVDFSSTGGEATLGRAHGDEVPDKVALELERDAVDGMAFGHDEREWRSGSVQVGRVELAGRRGV
ncbi:hypothetical protein GCM10009563_07080 [Subtercola frigoramans]